MIFVPTTTEKQSDRNMDFDDNALVSSITFPDPDKLKKHLDDLEEKMKIQLVYIQPLLVRKQ